MKHLFHIILLLGLLMVISCGPKYPKLEDLPETLPNFDIQINAGDVFDGFIFLKHSADSGSQMMINEKGEVVWCLQSDKKLFRPFTPYKESYVTMHSAKEAYEISYKKDTLNKWKFNPEGGFNQPLHHEIIKDNEGNLVSLTFKYIPFDLSAEGGKKEDSLRTGGLLKLSPDGELLWSWHLDQVIDISSRPGEARLSVGGHGNAIHIDADGNYLISWKDFSEVWKVSAESGELMWKYGNEGKAKEDMITRQHAITKNMDGDYMIFDNGVSTSRAFAFSRMDNGTFNSTMSIDLPDSLYSFKQGSVYEFKRNRFLFCSPGSQSIVITDEKGNILWLAKSNFGFYRAYYLEPEVLD